MGFRAAVGGSPAGRWRDRKDGGCARCSERQPSFGRAQSSLRCACFPGKWQEGSPGRSPRPRRPTSHTACHAPARGRRAPPTVQVAMPARARMRPPSWPRHGNPAPPAAAAAAPAPLGCSCCGQGMRAEAGACGALDEGQQLQLDAIASEGIQSTDAHSRQGIEVLLPILCSHGPSPSPASCACACCDTRTSSGYLDDANESIKFFGQNVRSCD